MIDIQSSIIKDFPNYRIYEDGRIQNIRTGRILKPAINPYGYLTNILCNSGITYSFTVHRLVALTFISNPKNRPQVNHIDGNKLNNHVSNLEWLTQKDNIKHAWDTGLCENTREICKLRGLNSEKLTHWTHPEHGEYYCSATELVRKFPELNLFQQHLSKVYLGKRQTHKGWKSYN